MTSINKNRNLPYDILVKQGATYKLEFTITEGVEDTPVDLTDATIRSQIRDVPSSEIIMATFTCEILDAEAGSCRISLTDEETSAIPVQSYPGPDRILTQYCYDVEIVLGDGTVIRPLEGLAEISPEVTR